jgi:hypothetical protein
VPRQRHLQGCSLVGHAIVSPLCALPFHDAPHVCDSHARAIKLLVDAKALGHADFDCWLLARRAER